MFECGLEGITLKIVKKSQFENLCGERNTYPITIDITKSSENLEASDKSTQNTPRMSSHKSQKQDGSRTPKMGEKEKKPEESGPKQEENDNKDFSMTSKDNGNVSSCVIEFKMVWFNFAAPPRAPITRKIDYTRYVADKNVFCQHYTKLIAVIFYHFSDRMNIVILL